MKKIEKVDAYSKINFSMKKMHSILSEIMVSNGVNEKVSEITSTILIDTEKRGHSSHGLIQFPIIMDKVLKGKLSYDGQFNVLSESDNIMVIDGMNGVGYFNGYVAMKNCINKAKKHGISIVTVRNSSHFGSGGFYTNLAVKEKLIGITMSNTRPLVSSHIPSKAVIGTNPISIGFPLSNGGESKFLLDMSTSVTSFNKVKEYANRNEQIPIGWGIDSDLNLTTDPMKVLADGALLPLGCGNDSSGFKGFYIAMMVEMFCSLLSGGKTSVEMNKDSLNSTHAFIVLDPDFFVGREAFVEHAQSVFKIIKDEVKGIYVPGETGVLEDDICVSESTLDQILLYQNQNNPWENTIETPQRRVILL
jgi:L-2-hydroxycarboxylate dehydrogenase (NAD+)